MILLVAIACIAVASLIFLAILKTAVTERSAIEVRQWQEQARWLADSGVERAAARLAADPAYRGETWRIPAGQLGEKDAAVVRIEVKTEEETESERGGEGETARAEPPDSDRGSRLSTLDSRLFSVRVQADFPDDPHHRARCTKQILIEIGSSE